MLFVDTSLKRKAHFRTEVYVVSNQMSPLVGEEGAVVCTEILPPVYPVET